jgi:metallo-beta-lactamase class B
VAHFRDATKKAKVDVALANHPLMLPFTAALEKIGTRKAGETNPFVVGEVGYQKFLDVMQGCTELAVARKKL